jgi:hypothetical protein
MSFTSGLCSGLTLRITLRKTLSVATATSLAMELSSLGLRFGTVCGVSDSCMLIATPA